MCLLGVYIVVIGVQARTLYTLDMLSTLAAEIHRCDWFDWFWNYKRQWKSCFYYWYCKIIKSARTSFSASQNTGFLDIFGGKTHWCSIIFYSFWLCDDIWSHWRFMWLSPSNINLEPSECQPLNLWELWWTGLRTWSSHSVLFCISISESEFPSSQFLLLSAQGSHNQGICSTGGHDQATIPVTRMHRSFGKGRECWFYFLLV